MYKDFNKRFKKAREGDVKSVEGILEDLHPLIITSIKRYYYKTDLFDDLIQDGRLLILECIKNYDESKGVYFLGYVKSKLKYLYLNKHKEKRELLILNKKGNNNEDDDFIDLLESGDNSILDQIIELEEGKTLRQAILKLPKRQRQVIISYFYQGLSIKEISDKYNIAYRTVVNVKAAALKKLRGGEYNG